MELKNKVVIVTGASDGIGAEAAKIFAQEGCHVAVCYNSQKNKGEEVFRECSKLKESILVHLDVAKEESIKNGVEEVVDRFGAIDILINNAGIVYVKDLIETPEKEIDNQVNVNLTGTIKMTKSVLPYLKSQDEGMVINVSSILGKRAEGEVAVYSATKFGVRGFTEAMAQEFNPKKIRFYCVNPRGTATKMNEYEGDNPRDIAIVIVKAAKEELGKSSGEDIDAWDYIK